VVQTVNGLPQFNVYDHWKMVMAINSSGNIVVQNVYGPGHDSLICSGKSGVSSPYFYHQDHNGSITGISDSSGIMRETVMYDPYGRPYMFDRNGNTLSKSGFANSFYFAGRPYTPLTGWNSGIYDMRHRFYAADIGRFMQGDPIGFKGGGNLYAYSGNNPVSRIDTSGLEDLSLYGGGGGGGGGGDYTALAPNPSYNPTDPASGPGGWEWSVTSLSGNYSWASPYNVVSANTSALSSGWSAPSSSSVSVDFQSAGWATALNPAQGAWDNAVTALENG
jgi:RHS repeat-associated protein